MDLKNTEVSYGIISRVLHWLMATIVIAMLAFGFFMDDMAKAMKPTVYMLHKSFGLLILALVIVRLVWNLTTGLPKAAAVLTRSQQLLATAMHHTLYLLLFIMPLTGLVMSIAGERYPSFFELFTVDIPGIPHTKALAGLMNQSHKTLAWVFIAMVVLHIFAAIYHRFIKDDGVFERMAGKIK